MDNWEDLNTWSDEEWFTLESITPSANTTERLICIGVDSPEKQFLVGESGVPTHNTDEGKASDALKGEAAMIIGSIARLGRAAGVHLVIATQRPDAKIISGETKANLGVRINCGRSDTNASLMILGNGEGVRVRSNPRGRLYLKIYGSGNHGQGFFAEQSWIDDYLKSKGLNPDGSPAGTKRSKLANVADMSQFETGDLDEREGVDNAAAIEKIRQEEEGDSGSDEWGFGGDAETDDEEFTSPPEDALGRPEIGKTKPDVNKFHRPEEDWDSDLEDLIDQNNE